MTGGGAMSSAGGNDWELGAALDMVFAARAIGDEAGERLGWIRFSESLRNVVQSILANQVIPITVQLRVVQAQHKEDAASQAHVNQMIIDLEEGAMVRDAQTVVRLGIVEAAQTTSDQTLKAHIDGDTGSVGTQS